MMIINGTDVLEVHPVYETGIIRETLSRIGIADFTKKIIYPTCYLYEVDGKFLLAHFKQMFIITRPKSYNNLSAEDFARRNAIAFLLFKWGMLTLNTDEIEEHTKEVDVIKAGERREWNICHKFNINSVGVNKLKEQNGTFSTI